MDRSPMSGPATGPDGEATPVFVEVTDTLSRPYTAGHQRIVRSLLGALDRLGAAGTGLGVVPVVRPAGLGDYRRLTGAERARLRQHPPGGGARRPPPLGPLSPVVRAAAGWPVSRQARTVLDDRRRRRSLTPEVRSLGLGLPPIGSVWLDLEPAWRDPEPRTDLLRRLRASGVHTAALVLDVITELHPEWYDEAHRRRFGRWLRAHLAVTESFLCLSRAAEEDLRRVADRLGVRRRLPVTVVPAGSDPPAAEPVPVGLPSAVGRYLLVVATIAARKNQELVVDAFDLLRRRHPDLSVVLVGREGRGAGELVARLRSHPESGRRLLWLQGIDDAELAWLYRNAFLAVAPSRHEGVGMPVIEALRHGCPVLCTAGGALAEAGGDHVDTIDPDDPEALAVTVERHLVDVPFHRRAIERVGGFTAPTWDDTAHAVARALTDLSRQPPPLARR
jgi:glycosyltransferase involved in cell wall biosynthesis